MFKVQVRPSRDLRNKYAEISNHVKKRNPVIITNNGKGDAVLISIEDYENYERYMHRQYVLEELSKAEAEAKDPNTKWFTHDDVWSELLVGSSDDV